MRVAALLCLTAMVFAAPAAAEAVTRSTVSQQLTLMAQADIEQADFVSAVDRLESAIVADPANARAFEALGRAYFGLGRLTQSQKYFTIALEIDPRAAGALAYLGEIDLRYDRREAAETKLERLSRVCGVECAEYRRLAGALSQPESAQN